MIEIQEINDVGAVDASLRRSWDAIAAARSQPTAQSEWMLSAHGRVPGGARLQLLVARDGDGVVGVVPLDVVTLNGIGRVHERRPLASMLSAGTSPLTAEGSEHAVAHAVAAHLAERTAQTASFLQLEWLAESSPWPALLRDAWPGRVQMRFDGERCSPMVDLDGDGDTDRWLSGYSKNFRDTLKRRAKRLARDGATARVSSDPADLERDVRGVFAAHHARFDSVDRRSALGEGHEAAVLAAAAVMVPAGRMRVWVVEHDGHVVGGQIHLVAGEEMHYWNGGFQPEWARHSLGIVLLHKAVIDAHEMGLRRLDLGPGSFDYKTRFAHGERRLCSHSIWPVGRRYPLARARLAPKHARQTAGRAVSRLPEHQASRVRALREHLGRLTGDR